MRADAAAGPAEGAFFQEREKESVGQPFLFLSYSAFRIGKGHPKILKVWQWWWSSLPEERTSPLLPCVSAAKEHAPTNWKPSRWMTFAKKCWTARDRGFDKYCTSPSLSLTEAQRHTDTHTHTGGIHLFFQMDPWVKRLAVQGKSKEKGQEMARRRRFFR